jgi:hypothetical protein
MRVIKEKNHQTQEMEIDEITLISNRQNWTKKTRKKMPKWYSTFSIDVWNQNKSTLISYKIASFIIYSIVFNNSKI